jgi:putative ubiquitin-RnfH superfamily antitoxin RatB of RatAB toxin-antitoxin module
MNAGDVCTLRVSVVYLRPGLAFERTVRLAPPATVGEAVDASGVRNEVAELARGELAVGVFSRPCALTEPLHDGDRVEIYRPLIIDPKEARRARAKLRHSRRGGAAATR